MVRSSQTFFIIMKSHIRFSDSYNLAKSQVRSRFRTFDLEKCFCHEILHRYSAPGFYQRISDAKVSAVCVHAFHSFHRLCFYIFLPLKINSINSEAPKTITRYRILFIFYLFAIKTKFPSLWAQWFNRRSTSGCRASIEQVLSSLFWTFAGRPNFRQWALKNHEHSKFELWASELI